MLPSLQLQNHYARAEQGTEHMHACAHGRLEVQGAEIRGLSWEKFDRRPTTKRTCASRGHSYVSGTSKEEMIIRRNGLNCLSN